MTLTYQILNSVTALVAVGLLVSACSTTPTRSRSATAQAKDRYLVGIDEMTSGNYTEAIVAFQQVVKSPGYIKYSAMARLRIGDCLFLQEKYDAAIEHYRSFLKQYEADPNAPYARFRIGHAFYEQIPAEWFLAPPAHEREQNFARNAANALRRFVTLYPAHHLVAGAREMLDDAERKLYDHEIYVAEFYRSRDKYAGVVLRLEKAFSKFPDLAGTEDNYMMLGQAYARNSQVPQAVATYQAYLERFPGGEFRDQATVSLDALASAQ
jgi:outer membrane protein assembly factor BamD